MNYKEFIAAIKQKLEFSLPEGDTVHITHILKNNNIAYDGINIFHEGACYSPNIYLNPFYEDYCHGASLDSIAENIHRLFSLHEHDLPLPLPDFCTFQPRFQENIFFRLINAKKNKKLLETIPHFPFLDLAITFHLLVSQSPSGISSLRITNQLCECWKLSAGELMSYARVNTPQLFPATCQDMETVLHDLLAKDLETFFPSPKPYAGLSTDGFEELLHRLLPEEETPNFMYILSNRSGINGATSLLYPDCLKKIAQTIQEDFYILPSSVHETILVPFSLAPRPEELIKMVREVNEAHVPDEEILSDHAYYYLHAEDKIHTERLS